MYKEYNDVMRMFSLPMIDKLNIYEVEIVGNDAVRTFEGKITGKDIRPNDADRIHNILTNKEIIYNDE